MTTNQADETIRTCIAAMDTVRGELQHLDHPVWRGTDRTPELLSKLQFSAINLLAVSVMCNVEEQEPEEVPFSKLYGSKQKETEEQKAIKAWVKAQMDELAVTVGWLERKTHQLDKFRENMIEWHLRQHAGERCEGCMGTEETHRGDCPVAAVEVLEMKTVNRLGEHDSAIEYITAKVKALEEKGERTQPSPTLVDHMADIGEINVKLRELEKMQKTFEELAGVTHQLRNRIERLEQMYTNRFTAVQPTPKFNEYNGRPCPYCHEVAHKAGKHDHGPVERMTGFARRGILISRILDHEGMALTEDMDMPERERMELERQTYVLRAGLQSMSPSELEEIVLRHLEKPDDVPTD